MKNVKMWTEGVPIEYDALTQIRNISQLPILAGHIAIMPDVHVGKGAVVGSVIPTVSGITACTPAASRQLCIAVNRPRFPRRSHPRVDLRHHTPGPRRR